MKLWLLRSCVPSVRFLSLIRVYFGIVCLLSIPITLMGIQEDMTWLGDIVSIFIAGALLYYICTGTGRLFMYAELAKLKDVSPEDNDYYLLLALKEKFKFIILASTVEITSSMVGLILMFNIVSQGLSIFDYAWFIILIYLVSELVSARFLLEVFKCEEKLHRDQEDRSSTKE